MDRNAAAVIGQNHRNELMIFSTFWLLRKNLVLSEILHLSSLATRNEIEVFSFVAAVEQSH